MSESPKMATTLELTPKVLQSLCQQVVRVTPTEQHKQLKIINYKLEPISDAPSGFLGRHLFLKVKFSSDDAESHEEKSQTLCFFTKSAPIDISSRMEYLDAFGVYKKEILIYREVLPELNKIFGNITPHCYYADNNLLVFENLGDNGYRMAVGRDGILNYEHLTCTLKTVATLHASSIIYERNKETTFDELHPDAVVENAYPAGINSNHVRMKNVVNATEACLEMIKTLPKYKEQIEYIMKEFPRAMLRVFDFLLPRKLYPRVFSHGDLWANNVMFQYGKYGEIPIQSRLVDFQLGRYAAPFLDLMTILTIPTSRKFRHLYLMDLVWDYYRYLTDILKRENFNIEEILPKQIFVIGVEEFRLFGLIESCLFSHLTILPPESTHLLTGSEDGFSDFFDRKRIEICMEAFNTDSMYKERMIDMLEDLVDNFVLKS